MSLYNEVIESLLLESNLRHFYRFQGNNSYRYYDMKIKNFVSYDKYVYFSSTKNHHKYYASRGIRCSLNKFLIANNLNCISRSSLYNPKIYAEILKMIINNPNSFNFNSIDFLVDSDFYSLIQQNSFVNNQSKCVGGVERVDTKCYGGGYGLVDDWLNLFNIMSFFISERNIGTAEVIDFLSNIRMSNSINNYNNMSFILENRNYIINPIIYNNFVRHEINSCLERILDNKLCSLNSDLYKYPTKTIREISCSYQKKRLKVLNLIDSNYRSLR